LKEKDNIMINVETETRIIIDSDVVELIAKFEGLDVYQSAAQKKHFMGSDVPSRRIFFAKDKVCLFSVEVHASVNRCGDAELHIETNVLKHEDDQ